MSCIFVESHVVDENEEVDLQKMLSHIENLDKEDQKILLKVGTKCMKPTGDTKCHRAFSYHQCWKKGDSKVSYLKL